MRKHAAVGLVLLLIWLNPVSMNWVESNMTAYMLVHIPGLVASGYWIGKALQPGIGRKMSEWNPGGIPGLLAAVFTILYWNLPRAVDAALSDAIVDLCKFISLPLFAGVPLAWSWPRINPMVRGLVWSNLVSKLFVMSWLYLSAPVRLCNNFLEKQQMMLGKAAMLAGIALAAFLALRALIGTGSGRPAFQAETQTEERRME